LDTVIVERNSLAVGSSNFGALRHPDLTGDPDVAAQCNWWGDASGPSSEGTGSGSQVGSDITFAPWLVSDDLAGSCDEVEVDQAAADESVTEGDTATASGSFSGSGTITITVS